MHVISGSARGRKLKGPPSAATRPMADKIKGALFNTLASLGVEPDVILDLYAGTGSIGIEALSRGASRADFVDQGRDQCAVIRANLAATGFDSSSKVHQRSARSFIGAGRVLYDFVIVDPPYSDPDILDTVNLLGSSSLVQSGTIVAIGHWPRIDMPDQIGRLRCLRHRCHGDSCYSVYEVVSDGAGDIVEPPTGNSEDAGRP